MQLNDIIEENTLKSISNKTRLSVENLERLFAQDFSAFRKVQALGFISILEREYHADLSDVREACHAYFSDIGASQASGETSEAHLNPPLKPSTIVDAGLSNKKPSFVKPLVVTVLVAGLFYAAWTTYSTGIQKKDANGTGLEENVGFFSSILETATAWIGGKDTLDTSDGINLESGTESDSKDMQEDENSFVIANTQSATPSTPAEEEKDIIQKVREEQTKKLEEQRQKAVDANMEQINDAIASAPEENRSEVLPLATEVPSISEEKKRETERSIVQEAVSDVTESNGSNDARKQEAEAAARQKAAEEAAQLKAAEEQALREREARQKAAEEQAMKERAAREKAAREKAAREKAAREKAAKARAAKAKIVVLKPRKKTWLGIVNLTNMKRRVATSKASQTFDTAKGRWIVATGHGFIDFDEGLGSKKFNDGKQHFLLIEKGKVQEISHERFQKLNKSKVW